MKIVSVAYFWRNNQKPQCISSFFFLLSSDSERSFMLPVKATVHYLPRLWDDRKHQSRKTTAPQINPRQIDWVRKFIIDIRKCAGLKREEEQEEQSTNRILSGQNSPRCKSCLFSWLFFFFFLVGWGICATLKHQSAAGLSRSWLQNMEPMEQTHTHTNSLVKLELWIWKAPMSPTKNGLWGVSLLSSGRLKRGTAIIIFDIMTPQTGAGLEPLLLLLLQNPCKRF